MIVCGRILDDSARSVSSDAPVALLSFEAVARVRFAVEGIMMKQSSANRKTNEQAREVLANILLFEVSDPRLHMVTITGCEVSYDRSVCNVYYVTEPERYEDVAAGFAAAAGRIRSLMGRKLSWRVTPELRFMLDKSVDEAERIAGALARDAERNAASSQLRGEDSDEEW